MSKKQNKRKVSFEQVVARAAIYCTSSNPCCDACGMSKYCNFYGPLFNDFWHLLRRIKIFVKSHTTDYDVYKRMKERYDAKKKN